MSGDLEDKDFARWLRTVKGQYPTARQAWEARTARLEQAEAGERRYEYLRTLNPQQFQELWTRNLNGEGGFDDLVDAAMQSRLLKLALGACQWPACAVHHPCERGCPPSPPSP